VLIKRVNAATFDVFWNNGWEFWARFQRTSEGALKHVNGRQMPTQLFQQFRAIINKKGKRQQVKGAREVQQEHERNTQQAQVQAAVQVIARSSHA